MRFPPSAALLPALALLVLAGCDNTIETPGSLRGTYTVYGALNPAADTQAVRIVPVRDTIGLAEGTALPISVVSIDLATGQETPWRDSVVAFANGTRGHVYSARTRPAYGSRQRLVLRRDEGGEVSALVAVPPRVEPLRRAVRPFGGLQYPILMPDAPQLNRVVVTYELVGRGGTQRVTRPAFGTIGPVEFGWQVLLDVTGDATAIQAAAGGRPGDFALTRLTVRGEVASEDWRPPGGTFDPDVLADPEALTNVRGGFGFVGAAYPFSLVITPTQCELTRTNFSQSGGVCPPP